MHTDRRTPASALAGNQATGAGLDGSLLWMGSFPTERLYAIDPLHWTVVEEAPVPGKPFGLAVIGDDLRVLCGEGEEDHRVIRRFIPGHGIKNAWQIDCPDDTGSQLDPMSLNSRRFGKKISWS